MRLKTALKILIAGPSMIALAACGISKDYSDSEKEMMATMTPSKYQPATRQMRTSIETQDVLAQAAFWSREYQLNPADLEAAVKLASAVRKMGNASKAAEITQTTRAMYPDDPYLIAEHSAALIALEKGREAIKPLDKALHSAPGYARLWSLKGAALDQLGNYDLARQHYNRALQITPNDPNIMANMGLSFALAGDPQTAEQWLRRAANHPEAGDGIRQNLDLVLHLQGKSKLHTPQPAPQRAPVASRQIEQRSSPYPVQSQARGTYTPPQIQAPAYGNPTSQPAHIGHRSSIAMTGNQPGAPKSAMEMARAAASKSGQSRIVVPHQPAAQGPAAIQGNILEKIDQSVNRKYANGQPPVYYGGQVPQNRQAPTRPPVQGYASPQQQQLPQQPVVPQQQQQGYPAYSPYETAPQRRGASRRR